ncbi:MAG: hypothetical protein ACYDCC_10765 [Actinomycetota bacterium]
MTSGTRVRLAFLASSALLSGAFFGSVMPGSCATSPGRAAIIVEFSARNERRFCVPIAASSGIPGTQALRETGLGIQTKLYGGMGEFICKIGPTGTSPSDCPARGDSYWAYFLWTNRHWEVAKFGASTEIVHNGDAQAWVWQPGGKSIEPSTQGIDSICSAGLKTDRPVASKHSSRELYVAFGVMLLFLIGALLTLRKRQRAGTPS